MTDYTHPYERHECDVCGRSLSSKAADVRDDDSGCIFCRGETDD
jgi:hypothetical protein